MNSGEAWLEFGELKIQGGKLGVQDVCESFLMVLGMRRRGNPGVGSEQGRRAGIEQR